MQNIFISFILHLTTLILCICKCLTVNQCHLKKKYSVHSRDASDILRNKNLDNSLDTANDKFFATKLFLRNKSVRF